MAKGNSKIIITLAEDQYKFLVGLLQGVKDDLSGVTTRTVVSAMEAGIEGIQKALDEAKDMEG